MFKKKTEDYFILYAYLSSIFVILFALYFQYFKNFPPCELCIYQRIPYIIIILICSVNFFLAINHKFLFLFISIIYFASFIVSGFHFGVEQSWWTFKSSCSNTLNDFENIDELRNFLEEVPITKCNEVILSFYGLSMAGYNVLYSLVNFIISIFYIRRSND